MERLLTQDEVVEILGLDRLGLKKPKEALRHLWRMGQIGYVRIAAKIMFTQEQIEEYIEKNSVPALEDVR